MKNRMKSFLAIALALAFVLTTTPLIGFAAKTITVSGTSFGTDAESKPVTTADVETGDTISGGYFYVTVNGVKDETTANYGSESFKGLTGNADAAVESGNTYYNSYTVPAAPAGYKSIGTATISANSDYVNTNTALESGNTVAIVFNPIEYSVAYDLGEGTGSIDTTNAKYGQEFALPTADKVTLEGKVLSGWNTAQDGSGTNYAPGANVRNLTANDGERVVLYAQYSDNNADYTVTYYTAENEQFGEPQTYKAGDKITPPAAPEKVGFTFNGWILGTTESGVIALPETMPSENLKAYASWTVNEYKVTYMSDGEEISSSTVPYGSDISSTIPSDPTSETSVFAGWFDSEGNNVYSYATVPAKDIVFTAKWLRNGNVVYMVDDKTYETYEVTEGEKIPVPEDPEKFGQKFVGWDPEVPETMPNEDLTFNAQFEVDKEFVTLVIGGAVIAGGIIAAIAGAGAAAITGVAIVGGVIAIIGAATVISKTHTVTYKVDGAVYKTYKVMEGKSIPVPADPSKDGYEFAGWNPEVPEKMGNSDLTFEAEWDQIKEVEDGEIPSTGSAKIGIAAFAALAASAAAAIIIAKKKKDDK